MIHETKIVDKLYFIELLKHFLLNKLSIKLREQPQTKKIYMQKMYQIQEYQQKYTKVSETQQ